jgi:hypothetical protein
MPLFFARLGGAKPEIWTHVYVGMGECIKHKLEYRTRIDYFTYPCKQSTLIHAGHNHILAILRQFHVTFFVKVVSIALLFMFHHLHHVTQDPAISSKTSRACLFSST